MNASPSVRELKPKVCCVCGSPKLAVGVLTLDRPAVLAAFPQLRPRRRFPLCSACRRKIRWVEVEADADPS